MFDSLISGLPSIESIGNEVASRCTGGASLILLISSEKEEYCQKVKNAGWVTVLLCKFQLVFVYVAILYNKNLLLTNIFLDLFCQELHVKKDHQMVRLLILLYIFLISGCKLLFHMVLEDSLFFKCKRLVFC